MAEKQGSLVCVGPGMTLGAHISQRCRNHIAQAEVVFSNCHPVMEQWIATMNSDVRSLQHLYEKGKDRRQTYRQMHTLIMDEVRAGKKVVGVFYGHPGVFAQVPHQVIQTAKEEGYSAHMEPGISAEDCLYADMGIDPGAYGCQHYEASQLLFYQRQLDPSAYLILWQVGLAGDISLSKTVSSAAERKVLVEHLQHWYPPEHKVALYECPFLMTDKTRIEWVLLKELDSANLTPITTLVVPPSQRLTPNHDLVEKLKLAAKIVQ